MMAASPAPAADAAASTTLVVRTDPRTGKLVRKPASSPAKIQGSSKPQAKPPQAKPPATVKPEISSIVEHAARSHDVDPLLVQSVIAVESNYNVHAVSPKGAEGLMQLMPPTARMLGVANTFDPEQNIEAGVRYLKYLQDLYKDDTLALAAYNAGPKAVDKFKSVPPYPETQNYVDQVGRRYDAARLLAPIPEPVVAPAASTPAVIAPTTEEQHPKLEQFVDENGRLHLRTTP
jgi:soluble lytic murein transglycosylase-like protein